MQRFWIWLVVILFCLIEDQIHSTETQPWLGNFAEFEWRNTLLYQGYPAISSGSHVKSYSTNSLFLTTSLAVALSDFGIELEATQASSRRQTGNIDNLKATGRYVWLDDIAGDPISFVTGLSVDYAFHSAVQDVSSFHHGRVEAECFISIGKEHSYETTWRSHWWVLGGIGVADLGSPWIRFNANYGWHWKEHHEFRAFVNTLWGLGHQQLRPHDFHGYGPIQHESIDLGVRYTYLIDFFGDFNVEYSYRVYACNFPLYAHRVSVQLLYTFGL